MSTVPVDGYPPPIPLHCTGITAPLVPGTGTIFDAPSTHIYLPPLPHIFAALAGYSWGFACPDAGAADAEPGVRCGAAVLLANSSAASPMLAAAGPQSVTWPPGMAVSMAVTAAVPLGFSPQQLQRAYMSGHT